MMPEYRTRNYDVYQNGDGTYTVMNLYGRDYGHRLSFAEACEVADLYQGDDDHERAEEDWNERHGDN